MMKARTARRIAAIFSATLVTALAAGPAAAQTQGGIAGVYATEPRYGSPNSIQAQTASTALNLFDEDFGPDGGSIVPEGDSDTIGVTGTYFEAGIQSGERVDVHYRHAGRLSEGSRARLLLDVPLSVLHADKETVSFAGPPAFTFNTGGATAVYGSLNAGVEIPLSETWVLTPRVTYSNLQAGTYFAKDAEQVAVSATTRYKVAQVGRGDVVFGATAVYQHTIDSALADQPFFTSEDYLTLRGGLAYQLPLGGRMFGRQSSLRGSYVYTHFSGTGMAYRQLHEVGLSLGVRAREVEQKSTSELFRIGLLYTHGVSEFSKDAHYNAITATFGYRF